MTEKRTWHNAGFVFPFSYVPLFKYPHIFTNFAKLILLSNKTLCT